MPIVISDALVLAGEVDAIPLTHPRILYDDIFGLTDTTLVVSTEAVGFEKENAADYLTYDFWQPTALPATLEAQATTAHDIDYVLIAAHNLGTAVVGVKPQYWNDSSWVDLAAEVNPGTDRVLVFLFTEVTASRVRILLAGAGAMPSLGVVMAGKALAMERGVPLDAIDTPFARKTAFSTNASEAGQFLGRSVRREGIEVPIKFNHLTASWVRTYFEPFIDHVRARSFFGWAWSPVTYPNDVAYCTCDQDIRPHEDGLPDTRSVEFVVQGLLE